MNRWQISTQRIDSENGCQIEMLKIKNISKKDKEQL